MKKWAEDKGLDVDVVLGSKAASDKALEVKGAEEKKKEVEKQIEEVKKKSPVGPFALEKAQGASDTNVEAKAGKAEEVEKKDEKRSRSVTQATDFTKKADELGIRRSSTSGKDLDAQLRQRDANDKRKIKAILKNKKLDTKQK